MQSPQQNARAIRFEGWEIWPTERRLIVAGQQARLGARAFDVLRVLVEGHGEVVTRQSLIDTVWPGLIVEDNNLNVQISDLRQLLGATAITTIPAIGYRLSALRLAEPEQANPALNPTEQSRPVRADGGRPRISNLPAALPRLFGRSNDLAQLSDALAEHRMVTVLGAGGVGKTRVAQAVAHALLGRFRQGCWIAELAGLDDGIHVAGAVAQVLGVTLSDSRPAIEEIADAIEDREILLVLDNCEFLVDAVARLVTDLLSRLPHLRILATSQHRLRVTEECVYRLEGLGVPASDSLAAARAAPAVDLLASRARELQRDFAVNENNVAMIVEICRRLDGLPLAIELAAARIPLLGVAGVQQRLKSHFDILTLSRRDGIPRHQTLRATLEWSHGLLDAGEARTFRRAGVFAGSFGLDSMHTVLGDPGQDENQVLDLVGSLADKSLITILHGEPPRYRLLESARAYALERLRESGEHEQIRSRHAQATLARFESALEEYWNHPLPQLVERYLPELENARNALDWSACAAPALHVALAGASAWIWSGVGQTNEGLHHCQRALGALAAGVAPAHEARLQFGYACLAHYQEGSEKLDAAERAVALYRELGDRAGLYRALGRQAIFLALQIQGEAARRLTTEMTSLLEPGWPPLARWDLLNAEDFAANSLGEQKAAEELARKQMQLANQAGDSTKELFAMMALEQCAATRGDFEDAVRRGRELVARARHQRYDDKLHVYVGNLATSLIMTGQLDEGQELAREAVLLSIRRDVLRTRLDALAMLAARQGRIEAAARMLGCAATVYPKPEPVETLVRRTLHALVDAQLPPDRQRQLMAEGENLTEQEAAQLVFPDDHSLFRQ